MNIYSFADTMTCFIESYAMIIMLETFCKQRRYSNIWVYRLGFVLLSIMFCISNEKFGSGILNSVGMSFSVFIISSLLYKGSIPVKLLVSVLGFLFIVAVELIVLFLITIVYGITVNDVVNTPMYKLLGIIVSKMITVLIVHLIKNKFKSKELNLSTPHWIVFLMIFANSIIAVFLIFKLSYDIKVAYLYNLSMICSFGLMFCTIATLFLYEMLTNQANEINNQKRIREHTEFQQKHIKEITMTQRQQARFRHNITDHLAMLKSYFESGDNQTGIEYIESIHKQIKSTRDITYSGNAALDMILNYKIAIAEEQKIKFKHEIQVPVDFGMTDEDICVVFGNALDNAIEACCKLDDMEKTIVFKLFFTKDALLCKIVNSSPEVQNIEVTSKADKDNHGLGIKSMRMSLKNYDSIPHMEYSDGKFTLKFAILFK